MKKGRQFGFIVECVKDGSDEQVVRLVSEYYAPGVKPHVLPQTSKGDLLSKCAGDAKVLICDRKCDKVFIIWDWRPLEAPWQRQEPTKPYRPGMCTIEAVQIWRGLLKTGIKESELKKRISLVCVPQELEAWGIADSSAVKARIVEKTGTTGGAGVRSFPRPEQEPDPERCLENAFRKHKTRFDKHKDVSAILKFASCSGFKRLNSCPSFVRFVQGLQGRS